MSRLPTVLAVDDDTFMRVLLTHVFVAAGFGIETFVPAQHLLDHADLERSAVILLDPARTRRTGSGSRR